MAKEKKGFVIDTKKEKAVRMTRCKYRIPKNRSWVRVRGLDGRYTTVMVVKSPAWKNSQSFKARRNKYDKQIFYHSSDICCIVKDKERIKKLRERYHYKHVEVPPKRVSPAKKLARKKRTARKKAVAMRATAKRNKTRS